MKLSLFNSLFRLFFRSKSKWEESDREDGEKDRNWRWSESPEIESDRMKDSKTEHSRSTKQSQRLPGDKKQRKDVKSSVRSSKIKMSSKKKHQLNRKRIHDNENQDKEDSRPSKKRKKRSRKKSEKSHKKSLEEDNRKSEKT